MSVVLTILACLCALHWFGNYLAVGVAIGGIFGIVNTTIIGWLTRSILIPEYRNPVAAMMLFTLKVPFVWGLLILGFTLKLIDPIGFIAGIQVFILSLVFCAAFSHFTAKTTVALIDTSKRGDAG